MPKKKKKKLIGTALETTYKAMQKSAPKNKTSKKAQAIADVGINALTKATKETKKKLIPSLKKASKPTSKVMTTEQSLQLQNATRTHANPTKANKMLTADTKKLLAKNYSNQVKANKYVAGFMQGFGPIDTEYSMRELTRDNKGNSQLDEKAIKKAKDSTGYKVAEAGGFMTSAILGGAGGAAEKSAVKGATKLLTKGAVKQAGKTATKNAVKKIAKESTEQAVKQASKKVTKNSVKKFVANRVGDVAVNTPINTVDSLKNARDEKGNISGKQFAKNMAVNVGLDMGAGAGIDLASSLIKKIKPLSNADKTFIIKAQAKKKAGEPLSRAEQIKYDNIMATVRQNAKAKNELAKTSKKLNNEKMQVKSKNYSEKMQTASKKSESAEIPKKQHADFASSKGKDNTLNDLSLNNKKSVNQAKNSLETEMGIKKGENIEATPKKADTNVKKADIEAKISELDNATRKNVDDFNNEKISGEEFAKRQEAIRQQRKVLNQSKEKLSAETSVPIKKQARKQTDILSERPTPKDKAIAKKYEQYEKPLPRTDEASSSASGLVAEAKRTAKEYGEDISDKFTKVADGNFDDYKKIADERAVNDFDNLYKDVMDRSDALADTAESIANKKALSEELSRRIAKAKELGEDTTELRKLMYESYDKIVVGGSAAGKALQYQSLLKESTPEGALSIARSRVKQLEEERAGLLKGDKIETPEDLEWELLSATTEKERLEAMKNIELNALSQVNYTFMEKFNAVRRCAMLANPKTQLRNLLGNSMFWCARTLSDGLEIFITHMVKKNIKKMGGTVNMIKLDRKLLKKNKDFLNKEFDIVIEGSGTQTRLKEGVQPEGVKMFGNSFVGKSMDWVQDLTYQALEKGDMLTFKPAFQNEYARFCQAKGWNIENLTKTQIDSARDYALKKAEYATFRDSTALSDAITKFKTKSQTSTQKRMLYRAGNMALESVLPFVKTPINIFRRSIDFSPISVIRATGQLIQAQKKGEVELLKQGIHNMATGLTGSGIFALGVWLADQDLITTSVGDVSGDAYYDRDMGFQDYSIKLKFGDNKITDLFGVSNKEYSATADWVAPIQVSMFMGAEVQKNMKEKGFAPSDIIKSFTAATGPMLDMSFMSTVKDTVSTFLDTAYRGEEASYFGAITGALFGSIPQGFLSSLTPQIMSQTAMATDDVSRDTRSTNKDSLIKSWESFGRKMINKVPGLRKLYLNPKLDRQGNDVQTGQNLVTRFVNAFINPSNVKQITLNENDKKLIDIYNNLPEGNNKKYYFYQFTGNPRYDLSNGKRMSYDEAYTYGKKQRQELNRMCSNMFNASSYANMTWDMRGKEVTESGYLAQTFADRKTYGNKYAADNIAKYNKKDGSILNAYKNQGGTNKEFVNFYIQKEGLINRCHDSDYSTKALAVALTGNKKLGQLYDIHDDKVKVATAYIKKLGKEKARKEYSNAMCNVISGIEKAQVTTSVKNKAVSAADHTLKNRTYAVMGISDYNANMGKGLKHYKYDLKTLNSMASTMKLNYGTKKEDVIRYVNKVKPNASQQEKACLYAYLYGYFRGNNNPFGAIKDYAGNGYKGGGTTTRSYSRGRKAGRVKASKGSNSKSNISWESYYDNVMGSSPKLEQGVTTPTTNNLNQAYINKLNKLGKNTH